MHAQEQTDRETYSTYTHACLRTTHALSLISHTLLSPHIHHLPRPDPDGRSKLQSCETLKPQSVSPRDSDFPAELLTCTTTAHSHRVWCYVPERDRQGERQTGRQKGSQRKGERKPERGRAHTVTQLPIVELYCTVYKRPEETLKEGM